MHRIRRLLDHHPDVDWHRVFSMSHLALNTTTRCQQRCVYCFEGDRRGRHDLDRETVRALIRDTAAPCGCVIFMGAEPTLNPDLLDHIAYAKSLGLWVGVSTNALRFKSRRFLDAAVEAGIDSVEFSFSYPDEDVYEGITRVPARGFQGLLQALSNINDLNREARSVEPRGKLFPSGPTVVVSQFNYRRLDEVISLAASRMPDTPFLVQLKAVSPISHEPDVLARYERDFFVPLGLVREAVSDLLSGWRHPFPLVLRGFPLCAMPGFEDLSANLYYHQGGPESDPVLENIHDQTRVKPMNTWDPATPSTATRDECTRCRLAPICIDRFLVELCRHEPLNAPVPSARDPREVLELVGFTEGNCQRLLEPTRP